MSQKIKVLGLIGVLSLLGCNSRSQSSGSDSTLQKADVTTSSFRMGTSADYPPFDFRKNGDVTGFDIEVAQEVSKRLGRTLEVKDMEFSSLIPALQSGQIDFVMAGMTVTEERKENVGFTVSYYVAETALLTRREDHLVPAIDSAGMIWAGKKLGVQLGTVMEKVAKKQAVSSGFNLISLAKYPVLLEELKAKRLDGVLMEKAQAQAFSKMNSDFEYSELRAWHEPSKSNDDAAGYAIAFAKSPEANALRDQVNLILKDLKKEGVLDRLQTRWLGEFRD